ncbi:AAA domain-containing protein [Saccharopolyspora gloriosae]|uniref:AAA domain-containing protein n=1 Tax=Saccharopolyspora gloriosae TaxID=455344 RepID=UPI001FB631EE|nr:AAA domain-containing protein [Saccharopolyspora gloriosae]
MFFAADTNLDDLAGTGVRAGFVNEQLESCAAPHKVAILDSCASGGFALGFETNARPLKNARAARKRSSPLSSRGVYVIGSARAREPAVAGADGEPSAFTGRLVEALRTGKVGHDGSGVVTVDDLFGYVNQRMREAGGQVPVSSSIGVDDRIVLARCPQGAAPELEPLTAQPANTEGPAPATAKAVPGREALLDYHRRCLLAAATETGLIPVRAEGEQYAMLPGQERFLSGELDDDGCAPVPPEAVKFLAEAERQGGELWAGYPAVVLHGKRRGTGPEFAPLLVRRVELVDTESGGRRLRPSGPVLPHPGLAKKRLGAEEAEVLAESFEPNWRGGQRQRMAGDALALLRETYRWQNNAELVPDSLDAALDERSPGEGARNAAVLLLVPQGNKADAGVLKDLAAIAEQPGRIRETALGALLDGDAATVAAQPTVVAPWSLNDRQREALLAAMTRRLSTVTGPPGTGKSQLVANIVATAIADGRRVLVASTNNKAVDEVWRRCEQVQKGALVRTGSRPNREYEAESLRLLAADGSDEPGRAAAIAELAAAERLATRARRDLRAIGRIDGELRAAGAARHAAAEALGLIEAELAERLGQRPLRWARRANAAATAWVFAGWRRSRVVRAMGIEPHDCADADPAAICGRVAEFAEAEQVWRDRRAQLHDRPDDRRLAESLRKAADSASEASTTVLRTAVRDTAREGRRAIRALLERQGSFDRHEMQSVLEHVRGWAVTCRSANRFPLTPGLFDLVVIDEASQCGVAPVLPLLFRARRAVVIGDVMQLKHIAKLDPAAEAEVRRELGVRAEWLERRSLTFTRHSAFHAAERATGGALLLDEHYRCHPRIADTADRLFYDGALTVLTDIRGRPAMERPAVEWEDVRGHASTPESGGSWQNAAEADAVVRIVAMLRRALPADATIGVVTPFRPQQRLLDRRLAGDPRVTVDTVHAFQGGECDAIVFSPVAAPGIEEHSVRWLEKQRNLWNVAITRARSQLIVAGHADFWSGRAGVGAELLAAARRGSAAPDPDEHQQRLYGLVPGASVQLNPVLNGHRVDASVSLGGAPLSVLLDRGPAADADPGDHLHRMLRRRDLLDPERGVRSTVRMPVWRLYDRADTEDVLDLHPTAQRAAVS